MEPVTHFLTGACLGRAGLNRKTALATVTLTLAAEAADLDFAWLLKSRTVYFAHHRGFTHTFLGVPFVAAFVLALVWSIRWAFLKLRNGQTLKSRFPRPPIRWGVLYLYACLGALSHILLDYTNNYGVRPFAPFNPKWYSLSIIFIIEPILLAALTIGLVMPSLFGLISSEVGARQKAPRGRGWAIFALLAMVSYWSVAEFEHNRAISAMEAVDYHEQQAIKLNASPVWMNPFQWTGTVETRDFFQTMKVDSLTPEVDPENRATLYYKPPETDVTLAAKKTYLGRVYLDWAMFPFVQTEALQAPQQGSIVRFTDLRFARPGQKRVGLGACVFLDPQLQPMPGGGFRDCE
ncbi:membrane-bound metal-dependent hydrolase [Candidatus Koribacter versatilis Ellin345]|uniref:Membrane-bound metal-dependent hydrolase n=1 Tax=Koribacter versatilis (strain Ellin345) TaxID=204669 RepID=Q1IHJ9_KORVE|nr:metal-dependent hydrolase [Candidatus Koribacter versatilis]ABF43651.1 membrane-bound metal-dependent hydrolase [Candidatus Koribacter versatilis Ellin345]